MKVHGLVLVGLPLVGVAAAGADASLSSLTVQDVQSLLSENNLLPFFGEQFEEYLVDGATLQVLDESHVNVGDFPKAKPFHWAKFWSVLEDLRTDDDEVASDVPSAGESKSPLSTASKRRSLMAANESYSGIHIKNDVAAVVLGLDGDVGVRRIADGDMLLEGRVLLEDASGGSDHIDVRRQLNDLLAATNNASRDERLDLLIDMVSLNTELIMNISANCGSSSLSSSSSDVPLYTCVDALSMEADSGLYSTESYGYVRCENDISIGGWTLAMNIDTSDGNVVSYNNAAFWQGETTLGGATDNVHQSLTQDYKNVDVFNSFPVGQILIVVHDEGTVLGWRAFDMLDDDQPLAYYFQGGEDSVNICGSSFDDQTELGLDGYVTMSSGSFDADVGELSDMEPLVYADDCELLSNIDISNTEDYNRLTCVSHPEQDASGNYGYGLGTLYDARHDPYGGTISVGLCPSDTIRPLCDGQLHTTTTNWGSASGTGGMIGSDNTCNGDCPWTVESGLAYDYAIYVREASEELYDSCDDAMANDAPSGAYLLSSGQRVYCNNDISLGGWTLALNIDTSDGNVVDYSNYQFWESTTELGGARDYTVRPFHHDYKNLDVFSSFAANEILVVVHEEGEVLGYRAWTLYTPGQPLGDYFIGENECGTDDSVGELGSGNFNYVTSAVIDADVGDLIAEEPIVYNDDYQLYANIETGESHDYNRLTAKDHPELGSAGNYGWGLGTLYDATSETSSADCPSVSARPLCDAQFHVTGGNWGSNGGLGGMIGTDNVCNDDCPWTVASDYEYDYAIYVRKATPVYYASCVAVAEAGETSGQYLLSSGDHVYCYIDDKGEGWTLALNIDTSDGNVVHYSNVAFWETSDELGGAKAHHATPFRQDYKNLYAFGEFEATEMMIIVHEEGVGFQNESLGWRSWNLTASQALVDYFSGANACGDGVTALDSDDYATMTSGITGGAVYDLVSLEPMVYNEYEVFANIENGNSYDFNRMSAKATAAAADSNKGWGLGTLYDATHTDSDYVCGPDGAETARPQCDAQMHTIGGNWGTSSGTGGMIGTDNVCVSDCEWTTESGYYYDYAIFVR